MCSVCKFAFAAAALFICNGAPAAPANLIRNGGFDKATPSGRPARWRFSADKTGAGAATVVDGALRLENTSDKGRVNLSQRVRVWRDTPYEISVRIKAERGIPIFQAVECVRGAGGDRKPFDHYLERGYRGPWKTFTFKLTTSPKTMGLNVNLGLRNRGLAWFDDVRVAPLSAVKPPPLDEDMVRLTPWRDADHVIDGWDWSLPPGVRPARYSGLVCSSCEFRIFPGNKVAHLRVRWRDVEPREGEYDFAAVREQLEDVPEGFVGYEFGVYGATQDAVPQWLLEKYKLPLIDMGDVEGLFRLHNVPIWDERVQRPYLKMVEALGRSGILQMKQVMLVYVFGISKSRGEEFWMPRQVADWCEANAGLTPAALERCMKERLRAWAAAAKGVERKLAWVGSGGGFGGKREYAGLGDRLLQYAYDLGMGQRCGFVEVYLYHYDDALLGQRLSPDGYLETIETCPPIAGNRAFGDENEEYTQIMQVRFGPYETFPHRYHESMLRALQMRRNFLWVSPASVDMDPTLTAYVSMELGRSVADAPDAWCYLRESYGRKPGKRNEPRPIKNFERWLHQRGRAGCRTVAVCKVAQNKRMWISPKGHKYDLVARRTDIASGNDRMGFALDDRFLAGGPHRVAVKITYRDVGKAAWKLVYKTPDGPADREVRCADTGRVRTATFMLDDAVFPAKDMDFDFEIQAIGGDATISFVRVVKR